MQYNYSNPGLMNQLYRQKENIENMINQYTQNFAQPPVQNIINTSNNSEIDVRFLQTNEDLSNIIISKKTLFIDENNKKISLKELDGTISKTYDIIIPKDEKDIKIETLENKIKELEEKINAEPTKCVVASNDVKPTTTSTSKSIKSTTNANF